MRRILSALLVLVSLGSSARAGLILSVEAPGVQASTVAGVTTENFDTLPLGNLNNPTMTAVGSIVPANDVQIYAADDFGGANNTQYLRVFFDNAVATLNLPGPQAYFGFWWSAADSGNIVELYSGGSLLGTFSASTTLAALGPGYNGNPNPPLGRVPNEKFAYLNFIGTGGTTFDRIVFRNTSQTSGFEMDNFSIRTTAPDPIPGTIIVGGIVPVPEPSTLALVSLGSLALLARLRRRPPAARGRCSSPSV